MVFCDPQHIYVNNLALRAVWIVQAWSTTNIYSITIYFCTRGKRLLCPTQLFCTWPTSDVCLWWKNLQSSLNYFQKFPKTEIFSWNCYQFLRKFTEICLIFANVGHGRTNNPQTLSPRTTKHCCTDQSMLLLADPNDLSPRSIINLCRFHCERNVLLWVALRRASRQIFTIGSY